MRVKPLGGRLDSCRGSHCKWASRGWDGVSTTLHALFGVGGWIVVLVCAGGGLGGGDGQEGLWYAMHLSKKSCMGRYSMLSSPSVRNLRRYWSAIKNVRRCKVHSTRCTTPTHNADHHGGLLAAKGCAVGVQMHNGVHDTWQNEREDSAGGATHASRGPGPPTRRGCTHTHTSCFHHEKPPLKVTRVALQNVDGEQGHYAWRLHRTGRGGDGWASDTR